MSTLVIAMLLHWPFWLLVLLVLVGASQEWWSSKITGRRAAAQEMLTDISVAISKYNQKVKNTTKK